MKPLIIITGPTAVGKTDISIRLAKHINGEIISADSVQVYRHMDIGSAKITSDEMQGIKHYLIDIMNPDEEFNVFEFQKRAKAAIEEIYAKGKIPIIVGGTGFYIQSVLYDIDFEETDVDIEYRKELEQIAETKGNEYLHSLLEPIDIESYNEIHFNNRKKVIRALEFYKQNNYPISKHNKEQRRKQSEYNFRYYVLNNDRQIVYDRINRRVDIMIDAGLVGEVESLLDMGYSPELTSMQAIGYKEIVDYINGNSTLEDAIEQIKLNTRHFAKRQLTWFRREKTVTEIDYSKFNQSTDEALQYILKDLKQNNIIKE